MGMKMEVLENLLVKVNEWVDSLLIPFNSPRPLCITFFIHFPSLIPLSLSFQLFICYICYLKEEKRKRAHPTQKILIFLVCKNLSIFESLVKKEIGVKKYLRAENNGECM